MNGSSGDYAPITLKNITQNNSDQVGIIYGDVGTTEFKCSATSSLEKNEYVQIHHEVCGFVLGQVDGIERRTNLSIEKAQQMSNGDEVDIEETISAIISIIGYRDGRGLLQVPRTPFRAGEPVYRADERLIRDIIGLQDDIKTGAYIGLLSGHDIPVFMDINSIVQKHLSVLAKTGGGKSYVVGVLIEEFMKHNITVLILDPHGEFSALKKRGKDVTSTRKFGVHPRSYRDKVMEFSPDTNINKDAVPLKFTLRNLDPREILSLTNIRNVRTYLVMLRKTLDYLKSSGREYTIQDIIDVLEADKETPNGVLVDELEYLKDVDIFASKGTKMNELIVKGKTTIINLRGTPPDIQQLIVNRITTALFELRKTNAVPPMMLVVEESHNFCPQQGQVASSKIFKTIASEGRKFGLGLLIVTQRAAKVDKNVLSQCNTQIILKVTNPNDLKAITSSVEGLTSGMADEIQRLPIGVAIVMGGKISMPLIVEIRPRETMHGGESVRIL